MKVDRRVTQPCRECRIDPLDAMDMMEEASRMLAEEEMAAFHKMKFVVDLGRRKDKVGVSSCVWSLQTEELNGESILAIALQDTVR